MSFVNDEISAKAQKDGTLSVFLNDEVVKLNRNEVERLSDKVYRVLTLLGACYADIEITAYAICERLPMHKSYIVKREDLLNLYMEINTYFKIN